MGNGREKFWYDCHNKNWEQNDTKTYIQFLVSSGRYASGISDVYKTIDMTKLELARAKLTFDSGNIIGKDSEYLLLIQSVEPDIRIPHIHWSIQKDIHKESGELEIEFDCSVELPKADLEMRLGNTRFIHRDCNCGIW